MLPGLESELRELFTILLIREVPMKHTDDKFGLEHSDSALGSLCFVRTRRRHHVYVCVCGRMVENMSRVLCSSVRRE